MFDAWILCFSAGDLFERSAWHAGPVRNRLPMPLGGFQFGQYEVIKRCFHVGNSKPFFGFVQPANGPGHEIFFEHDVRFKGDPNKPKALSIAASISLSSVQRAIFPPIFFNQKTRKRVAQPRNWV